MLTQVDGFYVALVRDNNSSDNNIKGYGISPEEAVENAWFNEGYSDDERPRIEVEKDGKSCKWHVVYGPRDQEIARCTDEDDAWHIYETIGYQAFRCTERLYDALENTLSVEWRLENSVVDLPGNSS